MEKIVGKIVVILLSIAHISCAAISLRVTDYQGVPLREVVVGETFKIEVVAAGDMRDFQIEDLNSAITLLGQQTKNTQYVNGVTTVRYSFAARGDKPGSYTIGPVCAQVSGNAERSNTVTLTVVSEQNASKKTVNEAFLRLAVSKKKAMVGEEVIGSVRFYSCKDDVMPDQFIQSDLSAFALGPMSEPSYGKETIDGIEYSFLEVSWYMAAKEPGTITIAAWSASYSVPLAQDTFGPFRLMQGLHRQQKRVYSNALSLDIAPLPPYDGVINGVGSFDDVTIHATSQTTKVGEANVIRIDIIGNGNLDTYEQMQLLGIPEGLKSYESKQYIDQLPDGRKKASYEYVVQGLKEGSWEIPPQKFTYFDVVRKQYSTHKTIPLLITVLPQYGVKAAPGISTNVDLSTPNSVVPASSSDDIQLNKYGSWYPQEYREIPFHWFVFFLALPLIGMGIQAARNSYTAYQSSHEPLARKKYAHARAYKAVADVEKRKTYHELYPIFVELFASRSESSIPECSDDAIITILRERGLSQDDIASWQRFFTDIMRLAYAGPGQQSKVTHDIIKRSYDWLNRLKGVL